MTDPEFADATYVEPITPEFVEKVIAKERPDALLATLGGQTALNAAMALAANGVLERYGVELIGASHRGDRARREPRVVQADRRGARRATSPKSRIAPLDGRLRRRGRGARLPGRGAAVVHDGRLRLGDGLRRGGPAPDRRLRARGVSPTTEVLLEESIIGWKEYELEVMRDTGRQRRHRLLDREPRPDGRAHRRLDHRRAGDDADRPRVPAPARPRRSASSARSASTPAAATSSSPSTPPTAGSS